MIYRRLEVMSDTELAYLAGLIDGDGCLYMRPSPSPDSYVMGIQITSCDERLISCVYLLTGVGTMTTADYNKKNRKRYWRWSIASHKDIMILIPRLIQYTFTKKRRGELMYAMGRSMSHKKSYNLTDEERLWRKGIYEEFKSLQTHQPIRNSGEFGGTPERTIPSRASEGEGVEVSPEIMDISAAPEMEDMTRAIEESVEVEQR